MKKDHTLKPYTINTTGADMTLELLSNKIESGDIEIPEFQRGHVWPIAKASKLIESFLLGLPVPQIFLYQEPITRKLLVVDGQQRLRAIHAYFKGIYKGKVFRLTGIESEWNGKTFDELGDPDKRRLKNIPLRSTIFEQVDPSDDTSIFEVFERLNTGGMLLTAQEVRNAVISGDLNKLTKELNQYSAWRNLNGRTTADDRFRDVELVLRFIALEDSYETYKKSMNTFLNSYLTDHKTLTPEAQQKITKKFRRTMDVIIDKIGSGAFRPKKAVSAALADAVYVGICKNLHNLPNDILIRYKNLLKDVNFSETTEQHTTDSDKVNLRIIMAIKAFNNNEMR